MNWKTSWPKKEEIERKWWIIDADDLVLGRMATKAADLLMGKKKVGFERSIDAGDHVIVINAKQIRVTGGKKDKKMYYTHSDYPGSLKAHTLKEMLKRKPTRVIELAVKRMLPKNKLGRKMIARLHVYEDENHTHEAQKPTEVKFDE